MTESYIETETKNPEVDSTLIPLVPAVEVDDGQTYDGTDIIFVQLVDEANEEKSVDA